MAEARIQKSDLIGLISEAISAIPDDGHGVLDLGDWQYYYHVDPKEKFPRAATLPPQAHLVGDIYFDLEYINRELVNGISSPEILLQRVAVILELLGVKSHLNT